MKVEVVAVSLLEILWPFELLCIVELDRLINLRFLEHNSVPDHS